MLKRAGAEAFGTFWLVFIACGTALFMGKAVGMLGVAIAFGLVLTVMCYAIGHISGCHVNPAVTLGLMAAGKFDAKDAPAYIIAQVIGAVAGAALLSVIADGSKAFAADAVYAGISNGYGKHSPGGFDVMAAAITEIVLTFLFITVILAAIRDEVAQSFAPLIIGGGLMLVHLIGIGVTGMSVNPARSTGPAIFTGGWAIEQLWLFWVCPIIGGIAAGFTYPRLFDKA